MDTHKDTGGRIGPRLEKLWERGHLAWPALGLSRDTFFAWFLARPPLEPETLVADDLYLVCAALHQVPRAAEELVNRFQDELERHAQKVVEADVADELIHELFVDLLTGQNGRAPRLEQYSGRGPLRVWLRMAVTRRALNTRRRKAPHSANPIDALAEQRALDDDPELAVMRRTYRHEMSEIFAAVIADTPQDERTLLRLHYGEGSTLNELAILYQTSRSALHRRLQATRSRLLERIAELVGQRLNLTESDRQSMMRLFGSDLRDSLGKLLR